MPKGIQTLLRIAIDNLEADMNDGTNRDRLYSRGLTREGYNGGYQAALMDVQNALNGVTPNRNGWWEKREEDSNG
jgi:hypothetical protein